MEQSVRVHEPFKGDEDTQSQSIWLVTNTVYRLVSGVEMVDGCGNHIWALESFVHCKTLFQKRRGGGRG